MKQLIRLIFLLTIAGCGSQRDLAEMEAKRPQWAKSKPVIAGYYTGTGAAPKTLNTQQYQVAARSNALKDIAEEISVNISSRSVLRSLEIEDTYAQEYSSDIATQSNHNLEGYELVETYEDSQYYFVFYKLSKAKFERIKQERIDLAINRATNYMESYRQQKRKNRPMEAISAALKSLEVIRPHMHEALETEFDGATVDLGNYIVTELQNTLNNIRIVAASDNIHTVRGQSIHQEQLTFHVEHNDGMPLEGLPVKAAFSAQTLIKSHDQSDDQGLVAFSIDKVITQSRKGTFYVTTDLEAILNRKVSDLLVRQIVRKMSSPSASLEIHIATPVFYIQSQEQNLTKEKIILQKAFSEKLHSRNFSTTQKPSEADFIVKIEAATRQGSMLKNRYVAWLDSEIKVHNQTGEVIFSTSLSDIKGIHLDYERAGTEAYKAAAEELEKRIFDDFYYSHFR
jgi:hypothetical protein